MSRTQPLISYPHLIALSAGSMAIGAITVDLMLTAMSDIGHALKVAHPNDQQLIVVVFIIANGVGQLFFGPLVDRFGRKPVLIWSMGLYMLSCVLAAFAPSFTIMLVARALQGIMAAAARISVMATVRDICEGREMAKVISVAVTVFMAAPAVAPSLGQGLLLFMPWPGLFLFLALFALAYGVWVLVTIPETLAPENQRPLQPGPVLSAYAEFFRNRIAIGYTLASAFVFSSLFAYVSAAEQVYVDTFHQEALFPILFGAIALSFGTSTLVNSRMVIKYGMRRISHIAVVLFLVANISHMLVAISFGDHLAVFVGFMMISFFAIGLIGPNMSSLAMEPMGHIAGAAAAANGFAGTALAGAIGGVVARFYDGTTLPLTVGFVIFGFVAFFVVLWTDDGAFFQPRARQ